MRYQIPPDIVHYEIRPLFGFTANDLVLTGVALLMGINLGGLIGGAVLGVAAALMVWRIEALGDRGVLMYLLQWGLHLLLSRGEQLRLPRILPAGNEEVWVAVRDAQGRELYRLGGGSRG
jgi:hypothetical protein